MSAAAVAVAEPGARFEEGLRSISEFRKNGQQALSECGACLAPLLEALGWSGRSRHLAESIPHFAETIDVDGLRETLANMNLKTFPVRTRQDRLNPGLLPCLFVPDKGSVRVVLSRVEEGLRVFDGYTRSIRTTTSKGLRGTAYIVRPIDEEPVRRDDLAWVAELFVRFRRMVGQVLLGTLLINILSLSMPLFMMAIYDIVIPSASVNQLILLGAGVAVAIGFEWLFRRLRAQIMAYAAGRIDYIIGTAGFQQVLLIPIAMTENEPLGAQISHLQEFESVREFFAGPLGETFIDLPFVVLLVGVVAMLSGWLALVPVTGALLLLLAAFIVAPFIRRAYGQSSGGKTRKQRFLIEAVSGMRAIKFAGAEQVWMSRFRELSAASALGEFHIALLNNLVQTIGRITMLAAGIGVIGFGATMVMENEISIGAMVATMALSWRILGPFQSVLVLLNRATQIRSSLRQINHLMRLSPERIAGRVPPKRTYRGRITFQSVGYRHAPDVDPALNGVSFDIEPGEVVAVTGPNGAGKTTIMNLASGLYRPQMGSVLIDGIDIRQLDAIDVRQTIGLVPQNSELLYGTVSQNFRLSVPWATDTDLQEAAMLADIHEGIMGLPEGYETRLTERMVSELPEGFKQKLAIARALLRKPPILLFDEPGQMLDERGDHAFLATVNRLRGAHTIVIVTHRPSHMRAADRLIVLNAGRVQFNGDPADALRQVQGGGG